MAFKNWKGKIKSNVSSSLEIDTIPFPKQQSFRVSSFLLMVQGKICPEVRDCGTFISSQEDRSLGFRNDPFLHGGVQLPQPKECFLQLCSWPFLYKCCFYTPIMMYPRCQLRSHPWEIWEAWLKLKLVQSSPHNHYAGFPLLVAHSWKPVASTQHLRVQTANPAFSPVHVFDELNISQST